MIGHTTCITLSCDGCQKDYDCDDITIHFDSEQKAREAAEESEWVITDRALCRECVEKAACDLTGHDWTEWMDRHHGDGQFRYCRTCGGEFQQRPEPAA